MMEYSAVIRTLGTAGNKYRKLLADLDRQTCRPRQILAYIAEGYPLPENTDGNVRYIYVKKGMVSQRALQYDEVETEYILFLDDDLDFPPDFVESMFRCLDTQKADVVAPDIYPNHERDRKNRIDMAISGRMLARKDDGEWGYKVMRTAGYSYNGAPSKKVYMSQTNAGACFLCKKSDFLRIRFQDEQWIEKGGYALGEDQAMYYKMYLNGLKVMTLYDCGIIHLDAGRNQTPAKEAELIGRDFRFKVIFWHRFIFIPEKRMLMKFWDMCCIGYALFFTLVISLVKARFDILGVKYRAIKHAVAYIRSNEYKALPKIK